MATRDSTMTNKDWANTCKLCEETLTYSHWSALCKHYVDKHPDTPLGKEAVGGLELYERRKIARDEESRLWQVKRHEDREKRALTVAGVLSKHYVETITNASLLEFGEVDPDIVWVLDCVCGAEILVDRTAWEVSDCVTGAFQLATRFHLAEVLADLIDISRV